MNQLQNYCFCTLAIGHKYRQLASLLAEDIRKYAPNKKFFILTDKAEFFKNYDNVITQNYKPISVKFYNDKRLVIQYCLEQFESCVYLDANIRIVDKVPDELNFCEGIVAYSCCSIVKHNTRKRINNQLEKIKKVCSALELDVDKVKFVHEHCFYVSKNERLDSFLKYWEKLANYFENYGFYAGEGNWIGIASAKADFPIYYDYDKKLTLFKDNIQLVRKKKKQKTIDNLEYYLDIQRQIEYPKRSVIQKIINKLMQKYGVFYRLIKLKMRSKFNEFESID